MTALVELTIEDKVAIVTLNRPEVRNAINDAMRGEFVAALESVAKDDAVRAVVLTGKGKAFCAGGDIAGMKERLKAPAGQVGLQRLAPARADAQKRRLAARHAEAGDRRRQRRRRRARLRHGARLRLHRRVGCGDVHDELRQARPRLRRRRHVFPAAPRRPAAGEGIDLHRPQRRCQGSARHRACRSRQRRPTRSSPTRPPGRAN